MLKLKGLCKSLIGKWSDMSPAAKASIALVVAKFFQKGLAMISGPIFTRIMPQSEYGIISTFTSWQSVLYIIATLNMSSGVFNNGMIDFKKDRDSFTFSIMCLANLCTLICVGIYAVFYGTINPILDMPMIMVVVMFLYFLVTPAYNYWMARERFEYKYKAITLVIIVSSLISTALAVVFVVFSDDSNKAVAKVVATEAVAIAIGLFFVIYTIKKSRAKFKLSYWKYALSINLPLVPHYLSMYLLSSADRIMITNLVGTSETAIYNVAYTVASIMLIFWSSVDASYAPWVYQKMDTGDTAAMRKRGNQILLLFGGMSMLCTLFAPEIIRILAPESYYSGIYVVPAVAAGVFFTACYSLYMRVELFLKKTKAVMIATCVTAALNLILNYVFIKQFGFIAAGYTTLVCYVLLAVFHGINLKRLGYAKVYDNKVIAIISVGVILMSIFVSVLYGYTIIRYIFIFALLALMAWKRKEILGIIKR